MNNQPRKFVGSGLVTVSARALLALLTAVSANAVLPQIDPIVDTERLTKIDAEAYEQYLKIMESAPDFETFIPNASDYRNIVYIDPSVEVSGSGASPEDPLKSWEDVSFMSGNAYLQKCGTEDLISRRLRPPADVLLGAYGEGPRPKITVTVKQDGDSATFHLNENTVIRDLHVRGPNSAATLRPGSSNHVIIYNNELEDSIWGIRGWGSNYRILANIIHNIGDDGVYLQNASNIEIGWNFIFNVNTLWVEPYTPQNIAAGDSIQFDGVNGWHVHHNVLDRSDSGNKFCFISNNNPADGTGLLEYNYMIGPKGTGDGGSTVYFGGGSGLFVLRYNTFVRSGVSAIYSHHGNSLLYGNLFNENTGGVKHYSNQTRMYHNVFWNTGGLQMIEGGGLLVNNIIDNRNSRRITIGGSYQNNLFSATPSEFAGTDAGGNLVGDPLFVDPATGDFRLSSGSPAINAAMVLTDLSRLTDRAGTPVPQGNAPDIGALEYYNAAAGVPAHTTRLAARPMDAQVRLRWDETSGATGYEVWRAVDDGNFERLTEITSNGYEDTGLTNGLTYHYRVAAFSAIGVGPQTGVVSATPQPATTQWAGFEIMGGRWVDTDSWLGLLNVDAAPWNAWVYSDVIQKWMYIPEDLVTLEGSWLFAPNNP